MAIKGYCPIIRLFQSIVCEGYYIGATKIDGTEIEPTHKILRLMSFLDVDGKQLDCIVKVYRMDKRPFMLFWTRTYMTFHKMYRYINGELSE